MHRNMDAKNLEAAKRPRKRNEKCGCTRFHGEEKCDKKSGNGCTGSSQLGAQLLVT